MSLSPTISDRLKFGSSELPRIESTSETAHSQKAMESAKQQSNATAKVTAAFLLTWAVATTMVSNYLQQSTPHKIVPLIGPLTLALVPAMMASLVTIAIQVKALAKFTI